MIHLLCIFPSSHGFVDIWRWSGPKTLDRSWWYLGLLLRQVKLAGGDSSSGRAHRRGERSQSHGDFDCRRWMTSKSYPTKDASFTTRSFSWQNPAAAKRLCRTGMLGHKLLRRCSKAGCIFVIGQEDPPKKAWKKPNEFMCLVLPFVCPPLAKGTWGSLQSRFFQSGKVLFWFKSRSTWLERLQKITEKLSPWNQSLLWMTGLMPFLSKQKMQANVEEALLLALVERSLSLFENQDVPAINKWFFVVLWPSS